MTPAQYRCLVAHMEVWKMGLDMAMRDASISASKESVIEDLYKAGWDYDESKDRIFYMD